MDRCPLLERAIPINPQAKARIQKPQGGGKVLVKIPGGAWGGWLKMIPV